MITIKTNYFYGNEVSEYGKKYGYVDYRTLAKAFDHVLCNEIMQHPEVGGWDLISGGNDAEIEELNEQLEALEENGTDEEIEAVKERIEELEDYWPEIFQYYIVSGAGAELLEEIGEIVYYNEKLDMYVWGVTHYGTSWDYVLTDIKIEA